MALLFCKIKYLDNTFVRSNHHTNRGLLYSIGARIDI